MLDVRLGDDGFVKYGSELQQQSAIASPDESRAMPLDELRQLVQRQKNGKMQTADRPAVSLVDEPDGTFNVVLQSGEVFKGFPQSLKGENREAIRRLAEGRVSTQAYYQSLLEQAVAQPQQPADVQQPTNGQHTDPDLTANQPFDSQAYLREETAKAFGFQNAEEMISDYGFMREQAEKYRILELSSSFHSRNQDFPNTDKAVEALEAVCKANNWDMENIDNLSNAHAVAVRHRLYEPLSQDQIRASVAGPEPVRRPVPPPIPRSSAADSQVTELNLWTEPFDQQRKRILAAQRAELAGGR
jgi:hypothetical protein